MMLLMVAVFAHPNLHPIVSQAESKLGRRRRAGGAFHESERCFGPHDDVQRAPDRTEKKKGN